MGDTVSGNAYPLPGEYTPRDSQQAGTAHAQLQSWSRAQGAQEGLTWHLEIGSKAFFIVPFTDLPSSCREVYFQIQASGHPQSAPLYRPSEPPKCKLNLPNFSPSDCPVGSASHLLILRRPLASLVFL